MQAILAIDGGGSRTRCRVMSRKGRLLGSGESGPSNHLLVAANIVKASLDGAINTALAQAGINLTETLFVSAGLAGVDYDGTGAREMEAMFGELGFARTSINGDMVIAHVGALSGRPGVLALAGTGSSILGIGASGERVKVGGWGPVYGDEGSAYRIAQNALRAAARARDSRGPETALLDELTTALGVNDFNESVRRVYTEGMETREIAALCKKVYDIALAGDEVAQDIFRQAGVELAESVAAAIRKLDFEERETLVSYQGAILESCDLVREHMISSLREYCPTASVVPPRLTPLAGAYLIGCRALGWELNESVLDELQRLH